MPKKRTNADSLLDRVANRPDLVNEEDDMVLTVKQPGRLISKVVDFGKVSIRVYSIGYLANALDRCTASIRRWERNEVICKPIIKTQDGARWYLKEEIQMYSKLAKQHDLTIGLSIKDTGFPQAVAAEIAILRERISKTIKQGG